MEKREYLRKYLIYILKNYDVYYITKDKVEREIFNLDSIKKGMEEESKEINRLFAIKNNEIRVNGKPSDKVESSLSKHFNELSYLGLQKRNGHYLDIKDDDTLEELIEKIRSICIDEEIDTKGHELNETEEKILEDSSVNRLKKARNQGIDEERKYLKEIHSRNIDKIRQEEQEFIESISIDETIFKDAKVYKLKNSRKNGIEEERRFLSQN